MLFSSTVFIFIFLPVLLAIYYMIPRRFLYARNILLLAFSLFFYAWGEPVFVLIMLLSIFLNFWFGRWIGKNIDKKVFLVCGIVFNLVVLFVFKYLNFTVLNLNLLLSHFGLSGFLQTHIRLPIGISFFTFQAMSYLVDVYRKDVKVQKNILYLGLYISFFPQLIAGPIVRYSDFYEQITERHCTPEKFNYGVTRFIYGLSKKVIIANNMALVADAAFGTVGNGTTVLMSWLGMIAYTLQIYFDFSGYSDMAIGLGKMFGFDIMENFNCPYTASSVSDFWRRWHMSLGTWFRDYVYFPLGGLRVSSKVKLVRNLFVVWTLTGVWHGASWNFIVWGFLYGVLITIEKLFSLPDRIESKIGKAFYQLFSLLCVMAGWVLFRAPGLKSAILYLGSLLGYRTTGIYDNTFLQYLGEYKTFLAAGILFSLPVVKTLCLRWNKKSPDTAAIANAIVCVLLLVISVSYIVLEAYSPFIYFNF